MKKYILVLLGIVLFSSSCEDEYHYVPDILAEDKALEQTTSELEPFVIALHHYEASGFDLQTVLNSSKSGKKALTKSIKFKRSAGTLDIVANRGFCDHIPAPLQMVIEGEGIATHLGRFTVKNMACMDWNGSFLSPVYGFITAACNSEIHTMMGIPYPDLENPPNLFYPYMVIGGTEKYQDASGYFLMYGYTGADGQWSFTGEGKIAY